MLTAAARGFQLSEPARLRKSLTATTTLLESMPPGSSRTALELAVERESLRLAAMSLVQKNLRRSQQISLFVFLTIALLISVIVVGWIAYTTLDLAPGDNPDLELFQRYAPTVIAAYFLLLSLSLAFIIFASALLTRRARETLAAQLFADGSVDPIYVRRVAVNETARPEVASSSKTRQVKPLRRRIATWLRG